MAKIRIKGAGKAMAGFIRFVASTVDCQILTSSTPPYPGQGEPHIWVFWHNRMFLIPWVRQLIQPGIPAGILSSPSGDGQVIADVCSEFGLNPVRGSSSRRGAQALVEMAHWVKSGNDIGVTPDGPRGPCYRLHMGVIKLAQLTGARLTPIHVRYSKTVRFKTWDRFMLPLPFSKVEIEFADSITVPRRMTEEQCEAERLRLEQIMRLGVGLTD